MKDVNEMNKNELAVVNFWEDAWASCDVDKIMSYLSDDISFTPDLRSEPVVGYDKCKEVVTMCCKFMANCTLQLETILGNDNIVFLERTEYVNNHTDNKVYRMPLVGVFEFNEEGKIKAWRDYCDIQNWPS